MVPRALGRIAVFEALVMFHRRAYTGSYLTCPVLQKKLSEMSEFVDEKQQEACTEE